MNCRNDTRKDPPWFLVQLKPNGFKRAETNLRRQGVRTFMPMCSKLPAKGKPPPFKPLFPGYLFVSFDPIETSFSSVNSTYGVSCLVKAGSAVRQKGLPSDLIKGLRARCDQNDTLLPIDDFKVDEIVRITNGPFSNFIAVVDKLEDTERVRILFDIMGQTVRSNIAIADLERANK